MAALPPTCEASTVDLMDFWARGLVGAFDSCGFCKDTAVPHVKGTGDGVKNPLPQVDIVLCVAVQYSSDLYDLFTFFTGATVIVCGLAQAKAAMTIMTLALRGKKSLFVC